MSHCVYYSCLSHLNHLGIAPTHADLAIYNAIKTITHWTVETPTHGSVAPLLVKLMARTHGLDTLICTHRYMMPESLRGEADTMMQKLCTRLWRPTRIAVDLKGDYGTHYAPAIYLLESQHAIFARRVPDEAIWMSIQLRR